MTYSPATRDSNKNMNVYFTKEQLGGGCKIFFIFIISSLLGEIINFDYFVSDGLVQPATRQQSNGLSSHHQCLHIMQGALSSIGAKCNQLVLLRLDSSSRFGTTGHILVGKLEERCEYRDCRLNEMFKDDFIYMI